MWRPGPHTEERERGRKHRNTSRRIPLQQCEGVGDTNHFKSLNKYVRSRERAGGSGGSNGPRGARSGGRFRRGGAVWAASSRPRGPQHPRDLAPEGTTGHGRQPLGSALASRPPPPSPGDSARGPHLQAGGPAGLPPTPPRGSQTRPGLCTPGYRTGRGTDPAPGSCGGYRGQRVGSSVSRPLVLANSLAPRRPRLRVATWRPAVEMSAGVRRFATWWHLGPGEAQGTGLRSSPQKTGESLINGGKFLSKVSINI